MGDIDFEEQLELERLEQEHKEKLAKEGKGERVDPDGTVYEWDSEKQAWFPKIDSDFIAQYQMHYGEDTGSAAGDTTKQQTDYEKYYNYYQNYNQAQLQHEELLKRQKKEAQADESHEETLQKLENLENRMQEQGDTEQQSSEYQTDSKEVMENYTEEQKKQYNEYWSYYYNTEYHDYYADCMAQYVSDEAAAGIEGEKQEKIEEDQDGKKKGKKRKGQQQQREEGWFNVDEEHNTNVYVSGLPFDITAEEFKEMMSKYGLIMFDPRTKQPKLKLYLDENGQPKGDGRCCFIKKESVDLILNLLDGAEYRGHKIKVERAQFQLKGDYDPSKKKKKLSNKEKRKLKERQAKLFDWRPDKLRGTRLKHEKVVVLKNVFDPKTFEDDPVQINVLTNDIRTECTKYGEVKKVVVYDRHEDGVVTVHFKEPEEADMCVEYMNQRYFAKRRLLAATWDGLTKYEVQETEAEREARLKKWEKFLETGEKENTTSSSDNTAAVGTSNGSSVSDQSRTDDRVSENVDDTADNVTSGHSDREMEETVAVEISESGGNSGTSAESEGNTVESESTNTSSTGDKT